MNGRRNYLFFCCGSSVDDDIHVIDIFDDVGGDSVVKSVRLASLLRQIRVDNDVAPPIIAPLSFFSSNLKNTNFYFPIFFQKAPSAIVNYTLVWRKKPQFCDAGNKKLSHRQGCKIGKIFIYLFFIAKRHLLLK